MGILDMMFQPNDSQCLTCKNRISETYTDGFVDYYCDKHAFFCTTNNKCENYEEDKNV